MPVTLHSLHIRPTHYELWATRCARGERTVQSQVRSVDLDDVVWC